MLHYVGIYDGYTFSVQDLENIVRNDVKVTKISTDILNMQSVANYGIREFTSVLQQIKYLENFRIDNGYLHPTTLTLLSNLPLKGNSTF